MLLDLKNQNQATCGKTALSQNRPLVSSRKKVRKNVMSIKFPPAVLGPEMTAPIFYGRLAFLGSFCWETPMPIKVLLLRGGVGVSQKGGGSANFIFMGVGIFPNNRTTH